MPDPDDDENDDDDNEDDEDEYVDDDDDCYEVRGAASLISSNIGGRVGGIPCTSTSSSPREGKKSRWDDDYVIKRTFSSLIPAFDPRPGRTNVNQTQGEELVVCCGWECFKFSPRTTISQDVQTWFSVQLAFAKFLLK